jgi:hypothetical protein
MKTQRLYCAVLVFVFRLGSVAFAQSTSQLHGVVTDPQGAAIAAARISLTSAGTGFNRQTATNVEGEYQFLQVPPGTYTVTVDMAGFTRLSRSGVQLLVNTPTTLDLRMEVATATQTVDVAEEASAINTRQWLGNGGRRGRGGRGDSGYLQSKRFPWVVRFRYLAQLQREFHVHAAVRKRKKVVPQRA